MKILHYSLGFPPYRSGGLTTFCFDLMTQQTIEGNEVALLWPGEIKAFSHEITIKKNKSIYTDNRNKIQSYEVINPLPISYDEGIKNISSFMSDNTYGYNIFEKFLNEFNPDVIHIHTFMGLHKSFLVAAKEKNIKLVFTTHDFFPICSKVTLFRNGQICDNFKSCVECPNCNKNALSLKKIFLLQSPMYRKLKDSKIIKKMRKRHRDEFLDDTIDTTKILDKSKSDEYIKLREYYRSLLLMMDIIHYNSTITKKIYEKCYGNLINCVIPISHLGIQDNRRVKHFSDELLKIRYLGPASDVKGYFILKNALDNLWKIKKNFRLDVHFNVKEKPDYMICHERYKYEELKDIFDDTDILVCSSKLYETFGFTVLEALSYAVPVIISDTVGANDILQKGEGIVIEDITSDKLYECFKNLNKNSLIKMNRCIVENHKIYTLKEVAMELNQKCYKKSIREIK